MVVSPNEKHWSQLVQEATKEAEKIKAFPVADPKLTVKIHDLLQQAMFYKQVFLKDRSVKF